MKKQRCKDITWDDSARNAIAKGVETLAKAVGATLGPKGRNVLIEQPDGRPPVSTKDGVTVAKEIVLKDRFQNMGAQMVKATAAKTAEVAGDGTTTATILTDFLVRNGMASYVDPTSNHTAMKHGMEAACNMVCDEIDRLAKQVSGAEDIYNVARISANSDDTIGRLISEAYLAVGRDGVITVEPSPDTRTFVKTTQGMQFDCGFTQPHFVTNQHRMECVLDNPLILICDREIANMKSFLPLLERIHKTGRPLLVIAEVDGEPLTTLAINSQRGAFKACVVNPPHTGFLRKEVLLDIAISTGATVIGDTHALERVRIEDLGTAQSIVSSYKRTTIINGGGDAGSVAMRADNIRGQIENLPDEATKTLFRERMAKLVSGVAVICAGGFTQAEIDEKLFRIDDALCATRAAVAEGIVPGGGIALIRASQAVRKHVTEFPHGDPWFTYGMNLVLVACHHPLSVITRNAGLVDDGTIETVNELTGWMGYNATTGKTEDMFKAGVIDPAKVTKTALRNAVSTASVLLLTDVLIADEDEGI